MIKTRLPLLRDSHTHVSFYAALGAAADLSTCRTAAAALALIKKQPGPLALARGWNSAYYGLGGAAFDRLGPAAVCNVSLHSFRLNAPARAALKKEFPDIVANIDDQAWVENNLKRVFRLFTASGGARAIPAYMERLAALGVWAADDMLVPGDAAALLLSRRYAGRARLWTEPEVYAKMGPAARAAIGGLKFFADGALGARTAALLRPYRDGGRGLLLHSDAQLARLFKLAARLTGRAAVHAIGDAAVEQLLRALERLAIPRRDLSVRVEHAQLIAPEQARRAKRLGLALCMQPNFSEDSACYADRLPPPLLRRNNPFRMLIDKAGFVPGADLVFGSDGMSHGAAPALRAALFPPCPGQRLTLEEFRAGYCLPDLAAGWLDLTMDAAKRKVSVKVCGPASRTGTR
jgi:predicted amidohydrolase YtcJ